MVDNQGVVMAAIKKDTKMIVFKLGMGIRDLSKRCLGGQCCRKMGKNVRTKGCLGGECCVVYKNVMFNEPKQCPVIYL